LPGLSRSETPLGAWLRELDERAHPNVVVVALAAKLRPDRLSGAR
jgi:transposase